jgi:hypothetical protein
VETGSEDYKNYKLEDEEGGQDYEEEDEEEPPTKVTPAIQEESK